MLPHTALAFTTLAFTSLLAIVNPLSAVPLFIGATTDLSQRQRAATLRLAVVTAIAALVLFGVAGTYILRFFGITTYAFRIAGGIIFLGIGSDMLAGERARGKTRPEEQAEAEQKEEIGIIPLGIPTLAGPGSITTVITLTAEADTRLQLAGLYSAIVAVMLVSWAVLAIAPYIAQRVGRTGLNVMTRIMGLIVMVIGVQFIVDGVTTVALDILHHR